MANSSRTNSISRQNDGAKNDSARNDGVYVQLDELAKLQHKAAGC